MSNAKHPEIVKAEIVKTNMPVSIHTLIVVVVVVVVFVPVVVPSITPAASLLHSSTTASAMINQSAWPAATAETLNGSPLIPLRWLFRTNASWCSRRSCGGPRIIAFTFMCKTTTILTCILQNRFLKPFFLYGNPLHSVTLDQLIPQWNYSCNDFLQD